MKYKVGDKIKIKSYEELEREIENGLKFKSEMFDTNLSDNNIFGLQKNDIVNLSGMLLTIRKLEDDGMAFKIKEDLIEYQEDYFYPIEFIKNNFSLPDHLFEV